MGEERVSRRLERRTNNKVVAGVCSGLGDYFGLDPLLFRIGFVLLALMGLAGVVLYLAAWILIPEHGHRLSIRDPRRGVLTAVGAALLVSAAFILVPVVLWVFDVGAIPLGFRDESEWPLLIAAILIVTGIVLLRRNEGTEARLEPLQASATTDAMGESPHLRSSLAPVVPRRERSALTAFTLAGVFLIVGTAALLSGMGTIDFDVGQLTALCLLIVGLGLLMGAWWGRARLLIFLGLILIPCVLIASVINFPLAGRFGNDYLLPTQPDELDIEYAAGSVTVDLSNYRFEPNVPAKLDLQMGAGSITVMIPRDVFASVSARARLGEAFVFRSHDSGADVDIRVRAGSQSSEKELLVNLVAGLGSINVYRIDEGNFLPQDIKQRERKHPDGKRGSEKRERTKRQ